MQRYFIDKITENVIKIKGEDFYHITKVMRMNLGNQLICCDGQKTVLCIITSIDQQFVSCKIINEINENPELTIGITIAQAIIRREKIEEVVNGITQLGAESFIPVQMERCNVKMNNDKIINKINRMEKIAKEAAEQSHRSKVLKINYPMQLRELVLKKNDYDLCLFAYEKATFNMTLKQYLRKDKYQKILIIIGPEGGISDSEYKLLRENHFQPFSLGPRILRTELAPITIMSIIGYEVS